MKFENFFYHFGVFAAKNKLLMMCLMIAISIGSMIGIINIRLETDPQELWVNKGGRTNQEQDTFNQNFGRFFRINQLFLKPRNNSDVDLFQKEYIYVMYYLQKVLNTRNINYTCPGGQQFYYQNSTCVTCPDGQVINQTSGTCSKLQFQLPQEQLKSLQQATVNVTNYCYKPISDKGCYLASPVDYWKFNLTYLDTDEDIKITAMCLKSIDGSFIPCSDSNGIPVMRNVVFGGIKCVVDQAYPCSPCRYSASALVATYLLNNDDATNDAAKQWEKEVYIDTINKFNDGTLNYSYYLPNEQIPEFVLQRQKEVNIAYLSERSIPDDLEEETYSTIEIIIISYTLMFVYIAFAIGSFPSKVHGGFLVGVFGIVLVLLAVGSSIGIICYMGQGLSMISAEVVPFLILAIGVDNMFIITSATRRFGQNSMDIPDKIGKAIYDVGPSITTAAICEIMAFSVGSFTDIPALSNFCTMAAIAVGFDYLFQMTAFVAFLSWDEDRKDQNNADCLFCIRVEEVQQPRQEFVKQLFDDYYIPFILNKYTQICVIIVFLGLLVVSLIGIQHLDLGLDQQVSVVKDGPAYTYFNILAQKGDAGPPAYVVLQNVNLTDPYDVQQLNLLSNDIVKLNTSEAPLYTFVNSFVQYTQDLNDQQKIDCEAQNISNYTFIEQIRKFKTIKISGKCCQSYGICGEQYEKDIVLADNRTLNFSRLRFQHNILSTSDQFIEAFQKTRDVVDYYSNKLKANPIYNRSNNTYFQKTIVDGVVQNCTSDNGCTDLSSQVQPENKKMFVYSLFYVYFEQYNYIRGVAIQNIIIGCAVVYACVLVIKDTFTAFVVLICVFCTTFDLIGFCWILNQIFDGFQIQINAISVVNLVISIGLSVEFCVHVTLQFMHSYGTSQQRVQIALSQMGSSVLIGIVCTKFIGVLVLAFASSTVFRLYYFRMYMGIIALGFFHGLMFLPVMLSIIGRNKQISGDPSKSQNSSEVYYQIGKQKLVYQQDRKLN